jgi:hypothetical protein
MVRACRRSFFIFRKLAISDVVRRRILWVLRLRLRWFLPALLGVFLIMVRPTYAQTSASATLSQPNTEKFPQIIAYLDLQDAQGFVHGLQMSDVLIREDDRQLPVSALTEIHPGVQFIVAVSPGPSFAIRDVLGNSRYSYVVEALRIWSGIPAQSPPDDLSLIAAGFPEALHYSTPRDWFTSFNGYQPDARNATPTLDVLARAVAVAGENTPRPGMGRAILFITSLQDPENATDLQDLVARAKQGGIRVFVWLIAAPENYASQSAIQLQNLANQTTGQFLTFSGVEPIPNLEDLLKPLRYAYALSYSSKITGSGSHQLVAEIKTDDLQISTPLCSFELNVLPPNPIFVSLPVTITRAKPEGGNGQKFVSGATLQPDLSPAELSLDVLIE